MKKMHSRIESLKQRIVRRFFKVRISRKMKLVSRPCPICSNTTTFITLFETDRYGLDVCTVRCETCGLVFVNPAPTESFLNAFYASKEYRGLYMGVTHADTNINDFSFEKAVKNVTFVEEHATLPQNLRAIDIGSAYGGFLLELKNVYPRALIYGVEPGINFAATHKDKFSGFYSSFEEVPTGSTFDLITLWHVLEHLYNPVAFLQKLTRVLSPQGYLIIEVPNYNRYTGMRNIHFGHLFHFDPITIQKAGEAAGLNVELISEENLEDEAFGMKVIFRHAKK